MSSRALPLGSAAIGLQRPRGVSRVVPRGVPRGVSVSVAQVPTARSASIRPTRANVASLRTLRAPTNVLRLAGMASAPGRRARNLPTARPPKTRMIVVYGLGCHKDLERLRSLQDQMKMVRNKTIDKIDVLCNTEDPGSVTYDVWKSLVDAKAIREPTKFVRSVLAKVCNAMMRGEKVILVGHSYGGSVVSRVAMYLKMCPHAIRKNLQMATFGSIFIPPIKETGFIEHFTYANDIARVCQGRRKCGRVTVMRQRPGLGPFRAHTDYSKMILSIASTGTIYTNMIHSRVAA